MFARTEFVRNRLLDRNDNWSQYLYRYFIVEGSGADGSEKENDAKSIYRDYFDAFTKLIDSIESRGFDSSLGSILLGDGGLVNGAHRLAIAAYLDLPVHIVRTPETAGNYDYRWMIRKKLSSVAIDAMAFNLVKMMPNCRATLLFDLEQSTTQRIEEVLSRSSEIIIRKRIRLSDIGKRRVVDLAYGHNEWWSINLLEKMTAERFRRDQDSWCDVIFTLENDVHDVRPRKTELRRLLPHGYFERRIHGSDEYSDTFYLAESLLNQNSLRFLNTSPVGSEARIFELIGGPVPTDSPAVATRDWVLDGSAVLEVHGIRQARDIDFISTCNATVPEKIKKQGDSHSDQYVGKEFSVDDIVVDPRRHLIHRGVKFVSLDSYFLLKHESVSARWRDDLVAVLHRTSATQNIYQEPYQEQLSHAIKWMFLFGHFLDRQLRRLPKGLELILRRFANQVRRLID